MGIKRWKLYSDYGDSAMCETGNQPAGHWHPVSEDDYVLHADHAAEVARLEARVEELTLKGKEREQIAVDDAELIQTLRAQLEAAKEATRDANFDRNLAQLTAQPDGVRASLWEQLAKCRGRIMDKQSADITCCFDQPDCEDHAEEKRLIQALAAPAPACGACAIEKRHSIPSADPHTCKDAPACKTCGGHGVLVDGSGLFQGGGPKDVPCPDCAKGEL